MGLIHSLHWPGAGPAVVALHGMVVAGRSMCALAAELAHRGCDVWVPDLPGFGLSDDPAGPLDVDELADSLAEWMTGLGLDGCVLLGNSFGTQVVASLAARHRHLAGRVVLVSPTIDRRWRRLAPPFIRGRGRTSGPPTRRAGGRLHLAVKRALISPRSTRGEPEPSLRQLLVSEYILAGPRRVVAGYRQALGDDIDSHVAALEAPLLVLRGSQDSLVSDGWARLLARNAPAGSYAEAVNAGHDSLCRDPRRLLQPIADFILPRPEPCGA